jgi:hypothetical protein
MPGPPRWLTRLNLLMLRAGLQVGTQHILSIPGRKTGAMRSVPVSLVRIDGIRYAVAGQGLHWAKNARSAGWGELERGRRRERVRLVEIPVDQRGQVLRAFWDQVRGGRRFVAEMFGLPPNAGPDDFERAAPHLSVFRIDPATSA